MSPRCAVRALYGTQADADRPGHCPARPVGGLAGRLGAGQRHYLVDDVGRQRRFPRLAARLAQENIHPLFGEAALQPPDRRAADASLPGNLMHRQTLRRKHDDAGALNVLEEAVAVTAVPEAEADRIFAERAAREVGDLFAAAIRGFIDRAAERIDLKAAPWMKPSFRD